MGKAAQRQFLVKVSGIDGYFMTKSGGNISADTNKVYDGGEEDPEVLAGPAEADNVEISRGFDPYRDTPLLAVLRRQVGKRRETVSVTPTDADLVAIGEPTVYSEALLVGLNEPEADASSSDASTYSLTWAVGAWK